MRDPRAGEIDIAWRRLLHEMPEPVLRLAFPSEQFVVVGPASEASVDRPRQLTADKLFVIRHGGRELTLHIEVEHKWRPTLPLRVFDYASSAHVLTERPVVTIVLLIGKGGRPPDSPAEYRAPGVGDAGFTYRYHVVSLASYGAEVMKPRLPPEGWPLLVAMRDGHTDQTIRGLASEIRENPTLAAPRKEKALELLFLVSAVIIGPDAARSLLAMESIIQSPGVQALISHFREEGREEGREEQARSALLSVLARRGLAVDGEVRDSVEAEHDLAQLEAWHDAAITAKTLADVFG